MTDFPKPGIQFKDITPVLGDAKLFASSIDLLTSSFQPGRRVASRASNSADGTGRGRASSDMVPS